VDEEWAPISKGESTVAIEFQDRSRLVIRADLPAIDPDRDIDIWIASDVLHIRVSRADGPEPGDHASDLRYGNFARDIALPTGTNEAQVTATYYGTQLEVTAPIGDASRIDAVRIAVRHE
jgi:HSP20 family protein